MARLILVVALVFGSGCAALPKVLPAAVQMIGAIAEAAQLIDLLANEAGAVYPERVPDDFQLALRTARASLIALQAAQLAHESPDAAAVQHARHAFRTAFVELRMVASRLGIITPDGTLAHTRPAGTSFGGPSGYVFPTPMLLSDP